MEFIDLNAQQSRIRSAIDARIAKVLDHGKYIMGPEVAELEEALADYVGVKHCVSCANGTDALQMSLMALGVGPGDIVFTTAFSFFATAEVIPLVGATPYFVDIEPGTYNLSSEALERAIIQAKKEQAGHCKAVIAVDLFGLPADYPQIESVCQKHGLFLIEDAAQSFGGSIGTKKCGAFGDLATTSFFPAKPLGCYGDGGAVFTDSDELASLCQSLRQHGKGNHKYENVRIGLNSRLDTIQAAILLEKLRIFDEEIHLRNQVAGQYTDGLADHYALQTVPPGYHSVWAQYVIRCREGQDRAALLDGLKQAQIPSAVYYPEALNEQKALKHSPTMQTPHASAASHCVFSVPMHPYLAKTDLLKVIEQLL